MTPGEWVRTCYLPFHSLTLSRLMSVSDRHAYNGAGRRDERKNVFARSTCSSVFSSTFVIDQQNITSFQFLLSLKKKMFPATSIIFDFLILSSRLEWLEKCLLSHSRITLMLFRSAVEDALVHRLVALVSVQLSATAKNHADGASFISTFN